MLHEVLFTFLFNLLLFERDSGQMLAVVNRSALHESGQLPLTKVFGEVPPEGKKRRNVNLLCSDVVCKMDSTIRVHDAELHAFLNPPGMEGSLVLGEIHKVWICACILLNLCHFDLLPDKKIHILVGAWELSN